MKYTQNQLTEFSLFFKNTSLLNSPLRLENYSDPIELYKKGHKIHIKKLNRGKFTDYCGGNVTDACILKGKNSPDPRIRKRATFAANARTWKHKHLLGGILKMVSKPLSKHLLELLRKDQKVINETNSVTKLLRKVPLEFRAFKKPARTFTPKQVEQEAREGSRDLMMWFKTPLWEQRALSRGLTDKEIQAFQNLLGKLLSLKIPPSKEMSPLGIIVEDISDVEGLSHYLPISIHNKAYPKEHFLLINSKASHPYYTGVHESLHNGTFNIGASGWNKPLILLDNMEHSSLNKVLRNALALTDRLEIDPSKYLKVLTKLQSELGMTELLARQYIGRLINYWGNPLEVRARAGSINIYKRNHPDASEEELTLIDNARLIFTDESLANLYGKIIGIGAPIIGASTYLGQEK